MTAQMMIELISSLEHTREGECSCDEVYAIADQYAESNLSGEDVERLKPLIHHHMKMCQECGEEYRALLRASFAKQSPLW